MTNQFKLKYDLISEYEILKMLIKQYGFSVVSCQLLTSSRNRVYKISDDISEYIFKMYAKTVDSLEDIEGEVELLTILKDKGGSVSYPINDIEGNHIQSFETEQGLIYGVLFSFAAGEVSINLNDLQLMKLGEELAHLHYITEGLELRHQLKNYDLKSILVKPFDEIKPLLNGMELEIYKLELYVNKAVKKLEELNISAFNWGYVHCDLSPYNIHFQKDQSIIFFDFDTAGKGYFIQDISCIFIHIFNLLNSGTISPERADKSFTVFLDSYLKIRELSNNEIDSLPYIGFSILLLGLAFSYHYSDASPSIDNLKDKLETIMRWGESQMN